MKRIVTIVLIVATLAVILGVVGIGVLLVNFDPNKYKSQFSAALGEATGWHVTLHDDLKISFLPDITLSTGRMNIQIPGSRSSQGIDVEDVTLFVGSDNIIKGFLDVEQVIIREASLNQDSIPDSFLPDDGSNPTVNAALASLAETQNGGSGGSGTADAEGGALASPAQVPPPASGIRLQVRFPGKRVTILDSVLTGKDTNGSNAWVLSLARAEFHNFGLNADMPITANGEFTDNLQLQKATFSLEAVASLSEKGSLQGHVFSLHTRLDGFGDLPIASGGAFALGYDLHTAAISMRDIKGYLQTAGQPGASEAASNFGGALEITPPKEGLAGKVSGTLHIDSLDMDMLLHGLDPTVRFVEAAGTATKGAPNFTRPKVTRVLASSGGKPENKAAGKNEHPSLAMGGGKKSAKRTSSWQMRLVSQYSLNLALTADELIVNRFPINRLSMRVLSREGRASLPFSFSIFGAAVNGTGSINANGAAPSFAANAKFKGLNMGKAAVAWTSNYYVGGVGQGSLDFSGKGNSYSDFIQSLKGKASFEVNNGEVRGFALIPPDLPHFQNLPNNFLFRRLSANAVIDAGKASTENILLESDTLTGKGAGVIFLTFGQVDLGITFSQVGRPAAVPVFISGPYGSLHSSVDMPTYQKSLDRLGLGYGYGSGEGQQPAPYPASDPYYDNGARNSGYAGRQTEDPYRRYMNRTPLGEAYWPPSGGAPVRSGDRGASDSGNIPPMRNPSDIIYNINRSNTR